MKLFKFGYADSKTEVFVLANDQEEAQHWYDKRIADSPMCNSVQEYHDQYIYDEMLCEKYEVLECNYDVNKQTGWEASHPNEKWKQC